MREGLDERARALLRLAAYAERLEALPRTGWITSGVAQPESVAAHSYMTTLIALWIADQLDEPVDIARLARMALLHDLGESLITDLPPQVKQLIGREQVKDAERRAGESLLEDAPASWREAFAQAQHLGSLEGRILKAADQIQMLIKALQYKHQQRGDVSRFFKLLERVDDQGIALVGALFEAIRQAHERDAWPLAELD